MILPMPTWAADAALALLRIVVAVVFLASGRSHVRDPEGRGESIGLPPGATRLLGMVEVVGAIMLALGAWAQVAAVALGCVMLGAIHRKIFVWKTGLWGEDGGGWYYDLLYLVANLVVLATGGGGWSLLA